MVNALSRTTRSTQRGLKRLVRRSRPRHRGYVRHGDGTLKLQGTPLREGATAGIIRLTGDGLRVPSGSVLAVPSLDPAAIPGFLSQGYVAAVVATDAFSEQTLTGKSDQFPVVGQLGIDLFRDGDRVHVDGGEGTVKLEGVEEVRVVTSFLENATGQVLLLRRSARVGSFRGRWAGVSGFLEDPTPEAQARREILEETGIAEPELVLQASGLPVYARDDRRIFVVYPFRFRVRGGEVHLDWEHTESEWVDPEEIRSRETVPKLWEVWRTVAPRGDVPTARNE